MRDKYNSTVRIFFYHHHNRLKEKDIILLLYFWFDEASRDHEKRNVHAVTVFFCPFRVKMQEGRKNRVLRREQKDLSNMCIFVTAPSTRSMFINWQHFPVAVTLYPRIWSVPCSACAIFVILLFFIITQGLGSKHKI